MKEELINILLFLKKPYDKKVINLNKKGFLFILSIFSIDFFITSLSVVISNYMESANLIGETYKEFAEILEILPVTFLIILAVIWPIIEEVIFRLPLKYEDNYIIKIYQYLTNSGSIYKSEKGKQVLKEKWDKYYPVFFYISAVLFAIFHLLNYINIELNIIGFFDIIIFPFLMGILLNIIRVKMGFWSAYLYHAFHNFVVITLYIILYM